MSWASPHTPLGSVQLQNGGDGTLTAGLRKGFSATVCGRLRKRCAHIIAPHAGSPPAPAVPRREALQRLPQRLLSLWHPAWHCPRPAPPKSLSSQISMQETSPSPLLTACSEGPRLNFYFHISLDFSPLNLVFLFRNQHMIQTASSKFSIACDTENAFSAAWDMYLEIMVLFIYIQ